MRHPIIKLFHVSNLLQVANNCRMVDTEFFGDFLCNCKRMSLDDLLNLLSFFPLDIFIDSLDIF